jgi:hypothetical protein
MALTSQVIIIYTLPWPQETLRATAIVVVLVESSALCRMIDIIGILLRKPAVLPGPSPHLPTETPQCYFFNFWWHFKFEGSFCD